MKKQTYRDIEVIIVDDYSTDNTENIISEWRKKTLDEFNDFIYLKLPRKVGYPWMYNIGDYLSKGEYIVFHSDSGKSNKYKIEKQVEFLKNNFVCSVVGRKYDGDDGYINMMKKLKIVICRLYGMCKY